MLRSYRYRLLPTRAQSATLASWVDLTRELYNAALQERRDAWQMQHVRRTIFDQCHDVAEIRRDRPEFQSVPIVVLRGALRRLDRAFVAFFRRVKAHEKPGYPRFKSRGRFGTIQIDDLGGANPVEIRHIKVPLLGRVRFKRHRPIEGTPKALRITRDARGRWFVSVCCDEVPVKPLLATGAEIGVDLGISTFAATSDGHMFENPRCLAVADREITRAQRIVSRRLRGSKRRRKAARILAVRHEHVANVRREHHISVARTLVASADTIYVENLNVKGLAKGQLAKQVHDAGWGRFLHWLCVKAEEAARRVVKVNPSGTSQNCSACGCEVRKDLSVRVHRCPHCGYIADRDINAARNILGLGRSLRREAPVVVGPRRPEKSRYGGPEHTVSPN